MMTIAPYRPTTDRLGSFFEDLLRPTWDGRLGGFDPMRALRADVQESSDEIRVLMEVPGVRLEDLEINLENNVLTVSGEKRLERDADEEDRSRRWHVSERSFGSFTRSFLLPRDVDRDAIQARLADGVLEVSVPKSEQARPRRIEIQNGGKRKRIMGGS